MILGHATHDPGYACYLTHVYLQAYMGSDLNQENDSGAILFAHA